MSFRPPTRRFNPSKVARWLVPGIMLILAVGLVALVVLIMVSSIGAIP